MAWTAPATATSNGTLTAATWNATVRGDLLESAPNKATAAGRHMVSTGANAITERVTTSARIETSQTTASTTYADLGSAGPAVTVTTGTSAIVWITAALSNQSADSMSFASFAVSGATTIAASDDWAVLMDGQSTNTPSRRGSAHRVVLTAGSNTFTMKYRAGSGSAVFATREIIVMPF